MLTFYSTYLTPLTTEQPFSLLLLAWMTAPGLCLLTHTGSDKQLSKRSVLQAAVHNINAQPKEKYYISIQVFSGLCRERVLAGLHPEKCSTLFKSAIPFEIMKYKTEQNTFTSFIEELTFFSSCNYWIFFLHFTPVRSDEYFRNPPMLLIVHKCSYMLVKTRKSCLKT